MSCVKDIIEKFLFIMSQFSTREHLWSVLHMTSIEANYFTGACRLLMKVNNIRISEVWMNSVSDSVRGLAAWMINQYFSRKTNDDMSPTTKQACMQLLLPKAMNEAPEIIALLENKSYSNCVIELYAVAACLHILLLHELVSLDAAGAVAVASQYFPLMQEKAAQYSHHISEAIAASQICQTAYLSEIRSGSCSCSQRGYIAHVEWNDRLTGRVYYELRVCTEEEAPSLLSKMVQEAKRTRTAHENELHERLVSQLHHVKELANFWTMVCHQSKEQFKIFWASRIPTGDVPELSNS